MRELFDLFYLIAAVAARGPIRLLLLLLLLLHHWLWQQGEVSEVF